MSATITLLVLLTAGEGDPTSAAVLRAARQTLDARVVVRVVSQMPGDAEARELERAETASAVAEVTWRDAEHKRASIHVYSDAEKRWTDREIVFLPDDAPAEQGRTIGYALASMLPEVDARAPDTAPPLPPAPTPPPQVIIVHEQSPAPVDSRPKRWAVDVLVLGALGGDGGGYGGSVGGRWLFDPHFALRLAFGAREGEIQSAGSTSLRMFGALGLAWRWSEPSRESPLTVGLRADFLFLRDSLDHLDADDSSPVVQSRFLTGADAVVEGSYRLSEGAALVVGLGAETTFGSTDIYLHQEVVARLPIFRGVAELGIRASF